MIKDSEITDLLLRIEKSNSFSSGTTYLELLKFLVKCTQSGVAPKEYAIAEHIFGKKSDKVDSARGRVYVYHLRKKLKQYFDTEGKQESYILTIPKGGYQVHFEKNKPDAFFKDTSANVKATLIALCVLLGISITLTVFLINNKQKRRNAFAKSVFWQEFFEDDKPVQVVVGDFFVFADQTSEETKAISMRVPEVNNVTQLEAYQKLEENQGKDLKKVPYTLLHKNTAEWVANIAKVLYPDKDFQTRVCATISPEDLHDYNLIYVGMQRSAGIFNSYFENSSINHNVDDNRVYNYKVNSDSEELIFTPKGDWEGKNTDYGLIAKYPGPKNNTIFSFSSLWDSATPEAIRNFTLPKKMAQVEEYMITHIGYIPQYFEMIIEVNGLERVGFESRIVYLKEITEK